MPILKNQKHELFALGLAKGMSQKDAYIEAGYVEKNAEPGSSKLVRNGKVAARVAELKKEIADKAVSESALTRSYIIKRLMLQVDINMGIEPVRGKDGEILGYVQGSASAANQALIALGKEIGMFVDRKEIKNVSDFKTVEEMQERERQLDARLAELDAEDAADTVH